MSIKRVAQKRRKELLTALGADGEFYPWAYADLATVDRFLSNFHRPLQRRMLHLDPNQDLPESGVVRVESTKEIFLISEPRDDASDNAAYDRMCVLHLVSGESGGYVEVFSYLPATDSTPDTAADYQKTSIGYIYMAMEYYSSKKSENSDEYYEGKFLIFTPRGTQLDKDGVFSFKGNTYKILQTYIDSSFTCALVLQQEDDMQSLTYYDLDAGSGYDVSTGTLTLNEKAYSVAGTVDFDTESSTRRSTVYIKALNLPFEINIGRYIANSSGYRGKVISVSRDNNAGGQYKVICEGS